MSVALVSVTAGQEDALNNARIKLVATWRKLMDKQHIQTNVVLRQKEDHAEKELKLNPNYEEEVTDCPRTDDQADNESKEEMQPTNRLRFKKEEAI